MQFAGAERGYREHAWAQQAFAVSEHDAHFGGTRVGIAYAGNVGYGAIENVVGESVQPDFRGVAGVHQSQIILKDVAYHPDLGKIGDSEQVGSIVEALHTFEAGDILFDNGSGNRGAQLQEWAGLRRVAAQNPYVLLGGFHVDLRFFLSVLRGLQIFFSHRAAVEEQLRAVQRFPGDLFVRNRLLIIGERGGEVRARNRQQGLALLHVVTQLYFQVDDAASPERGDVDGAVDVRGDGGVRAQDRRQLAHFDAGSGKQFRMIGLENVGIDGHFRPGRCGFRLACTGARDNEEHGEDSEPGEACPGKTRGQRAKQLGIHWITSRPTARFIWAAAVR